MIVYALGTDEFITLSQESFDKMLSDGVIRWSEALELYVID